MTRGLEMAKKIQKTVFIHDDLLKLVEGEETAKGVTISRTVNAALLQYFYSIADGPDLDWMGLAVGLDKGSVSGWNVPVQYLRTKIDRLESYVSNAELAAKRGRSPAIPIEWCKHELAEYKQALTKWIERGYEAAASPDTPSVDDIESRRIPPEELANMPELQDDDGSED